MVDGVAQAAYILPNRSMTLRRPAGRLPRLLPTRTGRRCPIPTCGAAVVFAHDPIDAGCIAASPVQPGTETADEAGVHPPRVGLSAGGGQTSARRYPHPCRGQTPWVT